MTRTTKEWRDLCAELATELEHYRPLAEHPPCLVKAEVALAEYAATRPGQPPTDDQLLLLYRECKGKLSCFAQEILKRWGNG